MTGAAGRMSAARGERSRGMVYDSALVTGLRTMPWLPHRAATTGFSLPRS